MKSTGQKDQPLEGRTMLGQLLQSTGSRKELWRPQREDPDIWHTISNPRKTQRTARPMWHLGMGTTGGKLEYWGFSFPSEKSHTGLGFCFTSERETDYRVEQRCVEAKKISSLLSLSKRPVLKCVQSSPAPRIWAVKTNILVQEKVCVGKILTCTKMMGGVMNGTRLSSPTATRFLFF